MDPVALATALAKPILAQVGAAAAKGVKARVWGDPEHKALERALRRALTELNRSYGDRLAEFDINDGFWVHEGAPELAKALVPGVPPSPVRLAERAVDSLGRAESDDERYDRVGLLRPAFKALLDGLDAEVRREATLQGMLGRSDAASTAQATTRIAEHLGAVDATDDDRVAYLRWLIDQHRYLRTVGVVRNTTVQLPLGEVFVGLQAQRDRNPGDRARAWFERERERLAALVAEGTLDHTGFEAALDRLQTEYGHRFAAETDQPARQPVLDAARDAAQLLVLGDPGTGKTTLLRYLALTHARALISGEQVQGRDALFPIYLRIGEYARQGFPEVGIGEFLPGQLRRAECTLPGLPDLLRRQLDAGRCLVLLDGLDEIASAELRRGVVTAVTNFVTAHARQGNRFVVTSRIAGYQAAPLPEPFRAVQLQDMDDPTISRFLDVYCREVERAETPGRSAEATRLAGAREATAIEQALTTNAGVRRLAANPLLLTALVLVHRASGRLPHRRVEAYVEVCNALGRTWRSAQGVAEADLPDERILTRWLTELGWWMHEHRPEGAATRAELLEVLGPLWAAHQGVGWDPRVLEAADPLRTDAGLGVLDFVDKADTHTGLLVERAPGRYGFAHLTFEEYYAGRALAFRGSATDRISEIRRRLHDPRYEEPILLALGLIGTDYVEQIDDVVTKAIYPAEGNPSPYEELLGRDFLFMLRVLADDTPLKTSTIDAVVNRAVDEWLDRKHSRCRFVAYRESLRDRLAALGGTKAGGRFQAALDSRAAMLPHDIVLPWCELTSITARSGSLPTATITALATIATDSFDPTTQIEAGLALAKCGHLTGSAVVSLAGIATNDHRPDVRKEAISALAEIEPLTEAIAATLIKIAVKDTDPDVRMQAMSALTENAPIGTISNTLTTVATNDPHPDVRTKAISALAETEPLTEAIAATLIKIAVKDTDRFVRTTTVSALLESNSPTKPIITTLTTIATSDRDSYVRKHAVAALSTSGFAEEVTAPLLMMASSDPDPDARVQAILALTETALTEPITNTLIDIATNDIDRFVREEAISALTKGTALSEEVVRALITIAVNDPEPDLRIHAGMELAEAGEMTSEVVTELINIATKNPDRFMRIQAITVLTEGGTLTERIIATLTVVANTDPDPDVRTQGILALAEGGGVTDDVVTTFCAIATNDPDPYLRAQAISALVTGRVLDGPVITMLTDIAISDPDRFVLVQAGSALADFGAVTATVAATLAKIATDDPDPYLRGRAASALATGGDLNGTTIAILVAIATTDSDPNVRRHAVSALEEAGALTEPVTDTLINIATTSNSWTARSEAVRALRRALPTQELRRHLISLFKSEGYEVRREAGLILSFLSQQHPDLVPEIRIELAKACNDPALSKAHGNRSRTGQDYAYEALRAQMDLDLYQPTEPKL
ncbi:HEAT repeat domain-containing protein [Micromonospora humidisoli]|uniref:HEAT repeat domain-containing protein n=1 Tax=Micromonospora humidisoli TaxID=2807622 RepID=A0ABS2J9M9_9ACTN|nr:HEAT repeat domain-containing protein [Micromonospora humidisoli]MBM7083250.1 HEAT repeat domain-containing protein [Micromonospora humidisoli]